MLIRLTVFCIPLLMALSGFAQPDSTTNALVFKVKAKKYVVTVWPADTVLYTNFRNPLTIRMADGGKIRRVTMAGAKITQLDSTTWIVNVEKGKLATLSVYRALPNKKEKLAYTRQYTINTIPPPTITVCGVKSDSVIDKQQLIEVNKLTAQIEGFEAIPMEVIAFKMIYFGENGPDTLITAGNMFSIQMKRVIHTLKPGTVLLIEEAWTEDPNGTRYKAKDVELFIDDTGKYNTGFRNVTKPR